MIYKHLKKIRLIASIIFFVAVFLVFVDIYNILPPWYVNTAVYLQFIPSLINFISEPNNILSGFIIILTLTFLFGRLYCSSICPLGTMMDIITRVRNKIGNRKNYNYSKPNNYLRYTILSITIIFYLFGSLFLINSLDPYSIFGRISNNLFRYIFIFLNNSLTWILGLFDIHYMFYLNIFPTELAVFIISILYLLSIILFASYYGRQFCNLICPVGSLLSIASKYSLFRIKFDRNKCTLCGACEKVCKAYCIDNNNMDIDSSRCISCYNCFDVCPENGFHYENALKKRLRIQEMNLDKRKFVISMAVALPSALSFSACSSRLSDLEAEKNNLSKNPVIPPGAISIKNFTSKCTSCYLCVSNCPTNVIRPTFLDFGLNGIFQPAMDYKHSFCNFDCIVCTDICPSAAIQTLPVETKRLTQIGKVKFIKKDCIVEINKKACGACSEHCPTKSVKMVPYGIKNLFIPEVDDEICIGCGACEFACPTEPKKSIYVESNIIHVLAKKPKTVEKKTIDTEDFPF